MYNPYKRLKKLPNYSLGDSILSKSFKVHVYESSQFHQLEIGNGCILKNEIIFETKTGKVKVGNNVFINSGTKLISVDEIEIGDNVIISWGCMIYDHNSHSLDYMERRKDISGHFKDGLSNSALKNKDWNDVKRKKIKICSDVWIGFDVVILKGVTIGEGAIVAARSVVTKDVPPWSVVAGNPAKVVKLIRDE